MKTEKSEGVSGAFEKVLDEYVAEQMAELQSRIHEDHPSKATVREANDDFVYECMARRGDWSVYPMWFGSRTDRAEGVTIYVPFDSDEVQARVVRYLRAVGL